MKLYGPTDTPETDLPPDGFERVSLVTDDETGLAYYQIEQADGESRLVDMDGDPVELSNWTLRSTLADIEADKPEQFFEAITATSKAVDCCLYCGIELPSDATREAPDVLDGEGWERIAYQHARDCEWITTRAHRLKFVE